MMNSRGLANSLNILIPMLAFIVAALLAAASAYAGGEQKPAPKPLPKLMPVGQAPSPADNPTTQEKAELGKKLFFDRRLSGDGTMSCATCHDPETGFSDNLAVSMSYPTTRNWRNSPTLINIAFATALFHDGRAASLEEQALFPMLSAFEMNQNLDYMEEEIRAVPEYVEAFEKIFGAQPDRRLIAKAIAAYERTILSVNSPLDRHLRGGKNALTPAMKKGLEVFTGKAGCVRCHNGVNLSDNAFYANGVPENPAIVNDPRTAITVRFVAKVSGYDDYENLKQDTGRYLVTKDRKDWKAFRTPTLRELSRTAPYMHNGVFASIEEAIEFYDHGGGAGNGNLRPLNLSSGEKAALRVFLMEALAGELVKTSYPRLP